MKQFYMQLSVWWETSHTYRVAKFKGLALVFFLLCTAQTMQAQQVYNFTYTGTVQDFIVPNGVSLIQIKTYGASGGTIANSGGLGGYAEGTLAVTSGQVLKVNVGGMPSGSTGGYNGGGKGLCYNGGGGASDVRVTPYSLNDRKIVAGGGGGQLNGATAGNGGGLEGGNSNGGYGTLYSTLGGTQVAAGSPGSGGGFGIGQSESSEGRGGACGGGGGGGWYGGGSVNPTLNANVPGAGGSSYIGGVLNSSTNSGVNLGHGKVEITILYGVTISETKSISCAGDATGELTATVTGGTAPYTYNWSAGGSTTNVNSNLTAGEYTVTVSDAAGNTSTVTKTIAVNDTEKPVITAPSDVTTDLIKTATVTLPNNNAYASSSPMVINFQDPLPVGAEMTGVTLTFTVQSSYLAAVSSSISGTGTGDFHPNAETKTVTFNYNGKLPNYVYGGTNNFTLYSWWNGVRFKGGTITIHYATQNPVGCTALVTVPAPTASDNCGAVTLVNNFNGTADASGAYPVGTTDVIWTATDANGNATTYTQKVTVVDNVKPTITAPATVTINTDPGKNTASGVVLGTPVTADNCEVGTTTSNAPATFPLGNTTVTWTVTDKAGNTATATQVVTVQDNEAPVPTIATLPDVIAECAATVTTPTATDNVDGAVTGTTADAVKYTEQGTYTINWTYTDAAGNKSTQEQTVIVKDFTKPTVVAQNIAIELDATGNASITEAQINNGSTDNCGIKTITLDKTDFTCSDVGNNTVTLTITDIAGNTESKTATVTVKDVMAPTAKAKALTVQLDANGTATITPAMVDDGSSDNCSISGMSLSKTTFDCSNIGTNSVILTVNDAAGNDRMIPQGLIGHWDFDGSNPNADLTGNWGDLILNSSATITSGKLNVVNGSIARTSSYTGQTITSKTLVSYVSINNLNVRSGSAMTIDRIATDEFDGIVYAENQPNKWMNGSSIARRTIDLTPGFAETVPNQLVMIAITYENVADSKVQITLYRNGVSIGSYLANNATSWSAGNAEIIFGARHFNSNTVIGGIDAKIDEAMIFNRALSASEIVSLAEKANQATAIITVEDKIAPLAITQNITVKLDATGNATITAAQVNNGSSDNCGIETIMLSKTAFDCSNVGENTVTLTVTDKSGNAHEATAIVTIVDETLPVAVAKNITVQLDANGVATITATDINNGSSDACGIKTMTLSKTSFDCSNVGDNSITLTITDNNGNVATATAIVKVEDKVIPTAKAQNVTIELDANGVATITATAVDNGSSDICGPVTLDLSKTTFGCANVGANTVTLTVTDKNGNKATVDATVTVADNIAPVALAKNITVQL
ncbi:beta strand repeat-containing protein, partial [Pontibacter populi]